MNLLHITKFTCFTCVSDWKHSTAPNTTIHNFEWISANAMSANGIVTLCPYWLIKPIVAAAGYVPWIKRFSLHTMLIVTTLAVLVLGIACVVRM
jgi:hypothetical protein